MTVIIGLHVTGVTTNVIGCSEEWICVTVNLGKLILTNVVKSLEMRGGYNNSNIIPARVN